MSQHLGQDYGMPHTDDVDNSAPFTLDVYNAVIQAPVTFDSGVSHTTTMIKMGRHPWATSPHQD